MPPIQKKVCLLGEFAVGKTSLVRRIVEGIFDDKYLSTVGAKVDRKNISIPHETQNIEMNLLIWDLAGGEKFDRVISNYYRGAAGAMLVCDLTRSETIKTLTQYAGDFWQVNPQAPLVVVGNKADLIEQNAITPEALAATAAQCQAPWFKSSAKTGENVDILFQTLGQLILAASKK